MSLATPSTKRRSALWLLALPPLSYVLMSVYYLVRAEQIVRRAELHLIRREQGIEPSRDSLQRLLWFHPSYSKARLVLAKVELSAGASQQAISHLKSINDHDAPHSEASFLLAKTYALNGQLLPAESELKTYLDSYSPSEPVWSLYFRILYLQTRTRDVLALFERKFASEMESLTELPLMLKAEFVPQDPIASLAALEEMFLRNPADNNVRIALALARRRAGDFESSESLLRQVLAETPKHVRGRILLAQWLSEEQRFIDASDVLWSGDTMPEFPSDEKITKDDRFWAISSRLATAQQEDEPALSYINIALRIRPRDKAYLSLRSQILRQLRRREDAADVAKKSIAAGKVEQELFSLANQLQSRRVTPEDCVDVAGCFRRLERGSRAVLWDRLGFQLESSGTDVDLPVVTP